MISAVTMAELSSRETRVPMKPPRAVASRIFLTVASSSWPGEMVPSISGSARKPSSVISLTKLLGVHSD